MVERQDIESLIRNVTEAVMSRMGTAVDSGQNRRAWLLLPVATGRIPELARQTQQWSRSGYQVRVLAAAPVAEELERSAARGQFAGPLQSIRDANLGEILSGLQPRDLLVVGSMGFELARATADLKDGDRWVRLVTQALLKSLSVILVVDDLVAVSDSRVDRLSAKSTDLVRELEGLGLRPARLAELSALTHRLLQTASTLSRAAGGLVTERDVEQFAAEGEKRLVLPGRTIVTPLARSRAAELGLELLKEDS